MTSVTEQSEDHNNHRGVSLPPILNPQNIGSKSPSPTHHGQTPGKLQEQLSFISLASPANNSFTSNDSGHNQHSNTNSNNNHQYFQQQQHHYQYPTSTHHQNQSSSPSVTSFHSATYGDMFGASLHFWLESIVARCRCDRVALFLPHPKHHTLVRVAMVGPTAQPVATQNAATALFSQRGGDSSTAAGPVTAAVLQTGVAANLSQVAQEDAADCPGTSVAKTALIVPVKPLKHSTSTGANAAIGVLFAVNKMGGAQVFSTHDQYVLISVAPSLAYMAETYPVDFAAHRFDPAPLHRIIAQFKNYSGKNKTADGNHNNGHANNKKRAKGNSWSVVGSTSNNNTNKKASEGNHMMMARSKNRHDEDDEDESTQANLVLPEKPPQLVYEQSGSESMIPYVALALEEKNRENQEKANALLSARKKKNTTSDNNNGSAATPTPHHQLPATITSPEQEKDRIFNNAKPTWEELAHEKRNQMEQQKNGVKSDGVNSLNTAQQIVSVGDFVNRMEQCWRDAVSRTIATERELTLRNAQVVDAHSILHRKQRRLEILKDVLVETLEKKV